MSDHIVRPHHIPFRYSAYHGVYPRIRPKYNQPVMPDDDAERLCRFCFCEAEDDDPLLTPCLCKGDQKYVHRSCLAKWQRSVLVSQPTHPAYYQRDVRQEICNVCKGTFDPPPPSRAELMEGFTGAELSGLLREGVLIVCEPKTSRQMARALATRQRGAESLRHWIKGVYLITEVEAGSASDGGDRITAVNLTRSVEAADMPRQLVELADRLAKRGARDGHEEHSEEEERRDGGEDNEQGGGGGSETTQETTAAAANMTRPTLALTHFLGGPCLSFRPTGLALLREPGNPAVVEATTSADADVVLGPDLSGSNGGSDAPADEDEGSGRWVSGDLSTVCALAHAEAARRHLTVADVKVIWGDARWARAQLLGELARGHWGMCAASVHDVFTHEGEHDQWAALVARENERVVYAPRSEMTEDHEDEGEDEGMDEGEDDEDEGEGGEDEEAVESEAMGEESLSNE